MVIRRLTSSALALAAFTLQACGARDRGPDNPRGGPAGDIDLAGLAQPSLMPPTDAQKRLASTADSWFRAHPQVLAYVQVDKPLYQPGETIWYRAHIQQAATLTGAQGGITLHLVSPKGDVVLQKRVQAAGGVATNDFILPPDVNGGEYLLRAIPDDGSPQAERAVIVATYQAPRLKKKLEFQKKAYGPGDSATAIVKIERATGEPFANRPLTGLVTIDEVDVARVPVTTDASGGALVRFTLPRDIARGDGLLTILADDGGITESVQKRVPIVLDKLGLALYPEGGDLVTGLPSRVYFEASNSIGKPADVRGVVKDDHGREVAHFVSIRDGMGRFALTPLKGRKYHVEIESPPRIKTKYDLPVAAAKGCTLRAADDPGVRVGPMRLAVACSEARTIIASAVLRERQLAATSVHVAARVPTLIALAIDQNQAGAGAQGAVRVTLFDLQLAPIAERLVYRGRGADLRVKLSTDKKSYGPRDEVALTVETRDLAGEPVAASLGV
jgi:alpha-2-macroglobulin-like protein